MNSHETFFTDTMQHYFDYFDALYLITFVYILMFMFVVNIHIEILESLWNHGLSQTSTLVTIKIVNFTFANINYIIYYIMPPLPADMAKRLTEYNNTVNAITKYIVTNTKVYKNLIPKNETLNMYKDLECSVCI